MKSFHQDNISGFGKGVDESDIKSKKNKYFLPDIYEKNTNNRIFDNSNIIEEDNQEDIFKVQTIKLPNINQHGKIDQFKNSGFNNFGNGDYKMMKHNLSNHSIENTILNTQYSKKMLKKKNIPINSNNNNFKKDQYKEIKKNYISPYAQKIMSNNLKIS